MQWTSEQIERVTHRKAAGETWATIGASYGVTGEAVRKAIQDRRAGRTAGVASESNVAQPGQQERSGQHDTPREHPANEYMGRIRRATTTLGAATPGRYRVAHVTDIHHGSKFCDCKALLDFLKVANARCSAIVVTGDVIDGQKARLTHEQRAVGADDQTDEAVEVWTAAKLTIPVVACGGNHDGYAYAATGIDAGKVMGERMREAGVDWRYLGQCLGRAIIHGAKWELWHPMGAGSTRNAVRRILNARAEAYEPDDRPHILAIGHYHRHTSVLAYPENVYCVSGGTFQRKGSEFSNRITNGWDVGASIVSYTVHDDGSVGEFAVEFFPVGRAAIGWAA